MKDDSKVCPLLSATETAAEYNHYAICIEDRCAWWLPEYGQRAVKAGIHGRCALSELALQAYNIANK